MGLFTKQPSRLIVVCLLLFGAAAAPALDSQSLVLSSRDGTRLFSREIRPGDRFAVAFTHSLALSSVEEVFEAVPGGRFRLVETSYGDFGAGLPHEEGPGQTMRFENGRIILEGFTAEFGELWLRIGHIANHRLIAPSGETVRLRDLDEPGRAIRIAIEAVQVIETMENEE